MVWVWPSLHLHQKPEKTASASIVRIPNLASATPRPSGMMNFETSMWEQKTRMHVAVGVLTQPHTLALFETCAFAATRVTRIKGHIPFRKPLPLEGFLAPMIHHRRSWYKGFGFKARFRVWVATQFWQLF